MHKTVKVKDLIVALLKENPEANVFVGYQEDYGLLGHNVDLFWRGEKIFQRKEEGYQNSEQPYSKGCEMHEMVYHNNQLDEPWIAILA